MPPFLARIKEKFAPLADEDVTNKKYVDGVFAALWARIDEIAAGNGGGEEEPPPGGGGEEPITPTLPSGVLLEIPANTTETFIFDVDPAKDAFLMPTAILDGISLRGLVTFPEMNCTYTTDTNPTPVSLQVGAYSEAPPPSPGSYMGRIPAGSGSRITLTVVHTYRANVAMTVLHPPESRGDPGDNIVISAPGMYTFDAPGNSVLSYSGSDVFTLSSGGTVSGYQFTSNTARMLHFYGSFEISRYTGQNMNDRKIYLIVNRLAGTITTRKKSGTITET